MILTRERIELISFSPIYQLFTLYQTSSNCSINCETAPEKHSIRRATAASIDHPHQRRRTPIFHRTGHRIVKKNALLMDTLFHRLLDRAVSATVRVSSPLIASIPITHSPAIPRAVVREGTWPCGSRFRHGVLRFLETKSMAGDSMEKKKEEGRRWFPRTRGMAGSLHRHRRGVLPDWVIDQLIPPP